MAVNADVTRMLLVIGTLLANTATLIADDPVDRAMTLFRNGDESGLAIANFPEPGRAAKAFLQRIASLQDRDKRETLIHFVGDLLDDVTRPFPLSASGQHTLIGICPLLVNVMRDDPSEANRESAARIFIDKFPPVILEGSSTAIHEAVRLHPNDTDILLVYGLLPSCDSGEIRELVKSVKPRDESHRRLLDAILARHGDSEAQGRLINDAGSLPETGFLAMDTMAGALAYVPTAPMQQFLAGGLRSEQMISLAGGLP